MAGRPNTFPYRVFAALVCLLVHLGSNTAFCTVAAATVAWIDGGHRVQLSAQDSGSKLVLSHSAPATPAGLAVHSHCPTCRALLLLADNPVPGQSDHVFNFSAGGYASLKPAFSTPPPRVDSATPPVLTAVLTLPVDSRARPASTQLPLPPPLPSAIAATATTVLLI